MRMLPIIKFIHNHKDFLYYYFLSKFIGKPKKLLDVGCGSTSPISKINRNFYSVGFDLFVHSINKSKKANIHNKYVKGNILKINDYFKDNSYDCVIALDVIEHFTKKDGNAFLLNLEKIAKKRVVIFTPNGYVKQNVFDGNKYQIHKSGWSVKDFKKRGYKVIGLRGPKELRGEFATITKKPWIFWGFIALILEPFYVIFPERSFHLLAVKNINNE